MGEFMYGTSAGSYGDRTSEAPQTPGTWKLLNRYANAQPNTVFVRVVGHGAGQSMTYVMTVERVRSICGAMLKLNLPSRGRVILTFDGTRWADFAACYIACQVVGLTPVPLAIDLTPNQFEGYRNELEPVLCITQGGGPEVPHGLKRTVAELLSGAEPLRSYPEIDSTAAAEIIYSSGTSGLPKGVEITHAAMDRLLAERPGLRRAECVHALPPYTAAGSRVGFLTPLTHGMTVSALGMFSVRTFCEASSDKNVRLCYLTPFQARLVATTTIHEDFDLDHVKIVKLIGDVAPASLLERMSSVFPEARVGSIYGLSEGGSISGTYSRARPGAVGRSSQSTLVRIVDDKGSEVKARQTGQVQIRDEGSSGRSYYGNPDDSAKTFGDGWLSTGDRGWLDADGYLYLTGRMKDVIISGGENISATEVERGVDTLTEVVEAAVFSVPHSLLGEALALAIVPRSTFQTDELLSKLKLVLRPNQIPRVLVAVDSIPRGVLGKIVKIGIRETVLGHLNSATPRSESLEISNSERAKLQSVMDVVRQTVRNKGLDVRGTITVDAAVLYLSGASAFVDLDTIGKAVRAVGVRSCMIVWLDGPVTLFSCSPMGG